jgi:hypothetical protein
MAGAEWDLGCQLADTGPPMFVGIWLSGDTPPARLNAGNTVDASKGATSIRR